VLVLQAVTRFAFAAPAPDSPRDMATMVDLTGDSDDEVEINDSPHVDLTTAESDVAMARYLASLCSNCEERPANSGYVWCQQCFEAAQARCAMCGRAPASGGHDLCQSCFLSALAAQAGRGLPRAVLAGFGGGGASSSAPPEDASYEQLIEWERSRGSAAPKLSSSQISALPSRTFAGKKDTLDEHAACCAICMEQYKPREMLAILPGCVHTFHRKCVARWLKEKPTCPVCQRDVREDLKQ
jgi:hypothetical protein